jgi:predicted RNA-binding Zn ribbon-like protein
VRADADDRDDLAGLKLIADSVCVDFLNTVERGVRYQHRDWIDSYEALVKWSEKAGTVCSDEAGALLKKSATHSRRASRVLSKAVRLRNVLRDLFASISAETAPSSTAIDALNEFLVEANAARKVEWTSRGPIWNWRADSVELERPLWSITMSAAELLTGPTVNHVRNCANPQCSWMFVDSSKNKTRRWCEMKVCGNQSKAREHYAKRRASE